MNLAAKEFIETGIDWASAALSRLAKEHGGPKQLIADIYENGYRDGYRDALKGEKMKRYGIIGGGFTGLVVLGGVTYYFYKKSKTKQKELEQQLEENAKLKAEKYSFELFEVKKNEQLSNENNNVIKVNFQKRA